LAPAPAKKVAKPESKESQKNAEEPAAPPATARMEIATAASIAAAAGVELDTQDGTQWFLGSKKWINFLLQISI